MQPAELDAAPEAFLDRLVQATNAHDLDALVDCFAADYVNETPAHPERGFIGRDQVRANWQQIFAAVQDLRVKVVGSTTADGTVWSEWEMAGTRRDGVAHLMRGVIVFDVTAGRAASARFYLEPVRTGGPDASTAVAVQLGSRQ